MGNLFRSEEMRLAQLFVQTEAAFNCVWALGRKGAVQFRDLNVDLSVFQRKFVNEVRRCDVMDRQLRYFEAELQAEDIDVIKCDEDGEIRPPNEGDVRDLETELDEIERIMREINGNDTELRSNLLELIELKHILTTTQKFFDEMMDQKVAEKLHVPAAMHAHDAMAHVEDVDAQGRNSRAPSLLPPVGGRGRAPSSPRGDSVSDQGSTGIRARTISVNPQDIGQIDLAMEILKKTEHADRRPSVVVGPADLCYITGVIAQQRLMGFERLLWRACRGNVYMKAEPIDTEFADPKTREIVRKAAFVIFFQGDQLKGRVKKICDAFHARLYACPDSASERRETLLGVASRCEEIEKILQQTTLHRRGRLNLIANSISLWHRRVFQMRATYAAMNLLSLDVTKKCLIGECWLPVQDLDGIRAALADADQRSGVQVPSILNPIETDEEPPTFFRTNKLTKAFQNIVDSYGTASYQEVNPAPYTVITFPFLFAVMFGDMGHGFIMLLSGLFLVLFENKLKKLNGGDIFDTFFGGRYVILLMGVFSVYTGFIYNEIYSKSANFVGSSWEMYYSYDEVVKLESASATSSQKATAVFLQLDPKYALYENGTGCYNEKLKWCTGKYTRHDPPYVSFDPVWNLAENKLLYINSFKMKMSVILGIGQMFFGVILSLINHLHFKDRLKIIAEFIPSMIFLCLLFVYLCTLIITKWWLFWVEPMETTVGAYCGSNCAPLLLMGFINSVMLSSLSQKEGFMKSENGTDTGDIYAKCDKLQQIKNCQLNSWYTGQRLVEPTFVIVALISVPVMLFLRPLVLKARAKKEASGSYTVTPAGQANRGYQNDLEAGTGPRANDDQHEMATIVNGGRNDTKTSPKVQRGSSDHSANSFDSVDSDVDNVKPTATHRKSIASPQGAEPSFNFGDVFVYQAIHTIEFALGCVSHTASYLRLWALSLAHSQLSEVLWSMVMRQAFTMMPGSDITSTAIGSVITYVVWMAFSVLTLSVLILMEGLSAFLHALRLHWVEFQSKFYHGQGYAFVPFTFEHDAVLVASTGPVH